MLTIVHGTTGARVYVIWLHPRADRSTVVHEAYHAACEILDEAGVQEQRPYEAHAYYLDWIFTAVWARVRPVLGKNRR